MKVKATNKFEKYKVFPVELGYIPKEGTEFEVTQERFDVLTKNNSYGVAFIEKVEEPKKEESKKATGKKTTKKNK